MPIDVSISQTLTLTQVASTVSDKLPVSAVVTVGDAY